MLEPIRGEQPSGVDLSGVWRMQDDFEAMERRIDRAIRQTDGVDERKLLRGMLGTTDTERVSRSRRRNRDVGGLVHVFLESAGTLRITQTNAGLFIAFDRSVVEEYRFGEARGIQTGGASAQRVSGWDGEDYVIETLDETGMKLTERYSMAGDDVLTREITLRSAEMDSVSIVQTFTRRSGR
ncbi:MAG: hypothetical protein R3315_13175 [Woeseiaceae bacterium]|nr:hypothetical protein [Woeseiaceae bacterium]